MSLTEIRLWKDVLDEQFGAIVSTIGVQLVRRGRQTFAFLVRETGLEPGQAREALVVLIQHRLVWYYTATEGTRTVAYYQARPGVLYDRLRLGTVVYCATQWFEAEGANIVRAVLINGVMTLPQVIRKLAGTRPKLDRKAAITRAFTQLVGERFLVAVQPQDTQIKFDHDVLDDEQRLDKIDALPTAKQVAEVQQERINREEEERRSENITGLKRKLAHEMDEVAAPESKRHALGADIAAEVDKAVYFGVHFERFSIRQRNQQIVRYFSERVNRAAGGVINTLLTLVEPHIYSLRDPRSVAKSVMQVGHHLPASVDMQGAMVFDDHFSGRVRPKNELVEEFLSVMQQDSSGILLRTDSRGGGEFAIYILLRSFGRQRANNETSVLFLDASVYTIRQGS
ncbi:hypothetical protein THASP1DRAFT_31572 [Thamnocephalis sphaerospora]|uniref:DNA-directed RNA polymerase III subunit RPC3 n=1 Tax=Thamnocephalis sphaerospora TaxID=78915 RepID=A0A4P9XLT2_9FUNG|nr:hypothetical protein THASP1DRAFT_31957 [Thamnocephalis sphaerospora]RKP06610.1 hypothetical protein THASP1DRAFT_31572 [Thamnocephalis sphaerospora]|eukprot:RKP06220.1 hypothetical protein THASP1DRAFT_31957 [Thamnocephalis sphaerospora]